jgi:S-adenosylmethionine:tRNA ribosyltransferase-isomerase
MRTFSNFIIRVLSLSLTDFDYPLPKELIAQTPSSPRDASRLLVVDRKTSALEDKRFFEIADLIPARDVLVLNDTKVFKARLLGKKKKTEGKVDLLLVSPAANHNSKNIWRALIQPALKEGQEVLFPDGVEAVCLGRDSEGMALVEFRAAVEVRSWAEKTGTMPLPPYIKREPQEKDECAYQTVYAKNEGAVAAPTAGLHFTGELLHRLLLKGIEICRVTLHVGYGTFKPVEDLENHRMHAESFELSSETAEKINKAKAEKRKIWAVGTTTLRVLETCVRKEVLVPGKGETTLFVTPPFKFEIVDRLVTNFHLPKTTLLLLVSAFLGEDLRKKAYEHAIAEKYRFYSYGDAMVIL